MGEFFKFLPRAIGVSALGIGALLTLYIAWGAFIVGEGRWHLFWTVARPHYRFSFAIQTPNGVHSAQTVVEAEYWESPSWEKIPPLDMGEGFCCGVELIGSAAALQMPNGAVVCMLQDNVYMFGTPRRYSFFDIANALLTDIPNSPFASTGGGETDDRRANCLPGHWRRGHSVGFDAADGGFCGAEQSS